MEANKRQLETEVLEAGKNKVIQLHQVQKFKLKSTVEESNLGKKAN